MDKIYGGRPFNLGRIKLDPKEMMFWLYCPIKLPRRPTDKRAELALSYPANLAQFEPIVDRAIRSLEMDLDDRYIYLTAKTLWVTADNPGNRRSEERRGGKECVSRGRSGWARDN